MARRLALACGAAALLALAAGCSGGDEPEPMTVGMRDNFYGRAVFQVPEGQPVRFRNDGQVPHDAVAVDGAFGTELLDPGESQTIVLDEPGVYEYYCTLHGTEDGEGMTATLLVGDVDPPAVSDRGETLPVTAEASGVTRQVPEDYPSIQSAVDAAAPGDLVLVGPGVYREEVRVTTPSLVIRGRDRNAVVVDGEFQRPNGFNITADGVAVENLTVRNATTNGVFWTNVTGYRGSYLTAYNNRVYGIYAFDATDGLFEHSYASGSYDAGFYIGQCDPCDAVIDDVVAEWNGLGYSGTNAGGNLHILRSVWRHNVSGIVPNSLDSELLPPFERVHIAGNLVHDNGNTEAPTGALEWSSYGSGIILAGGNDSVVERNVVLNHPFHGILVTPMLDRHFYTSGGNVVRDNVVEGSGRADIALAGPADGGNCFSGNDVRATIPAGLEALAGCDGLRLPARFDLSPTMHSLGLVAEAGLGWYPDNPSEEAPVPPPQAQMPDAATAPVRPAVGVYASVAVDPATVALPEVPAALAVTQSKELTVFGVSLLGTTSFWQVLFGLYGYLLPFVLYAAWVAIALWDVARRQAAVAGADASGGADALGRPAALGWIAAILLVPFIGVIAYLAVGASRALPGWLRAAVVGGGLLAYLLVLVIGALAGGIV